MGIFMNFVADIILAILAVIIVVRCTKMGCFKAVTNLARIGIAILLTSLFGKSVSNVFYDKLFYPKVSNWVSGELNSIAEGADNSISEMFTNVPEKFQKLLNTAGVSLDKLKDTYLGSDNIDTAVDGMTHDISAPFARLLSNVVGYLTLFLIIIVVLTVAFFFLDKVITKLPFIKQCNRILGFVFGLACAFLVLCISAYILTAIFGFMKVNPQTIANDSILYRLFYKIDLLSLLK